MSDSSTPDPGSNGSPTDDTVRVGSEAPTAPAATASEAPKARRTVTMPVWVLGLLAVVVLVVGAFFVGRGTADKTEGPKTLSDVVQESARGDLPVGQFDANQLIEALRQNPNLGNALGNLLGGLQNR